MLIRSFGEKNRSVRRERHGLRQAQVQLLTTDPEDQRVVKDPAIVVSASRTAGVTSAPSGTFHAMEIATRSLQRRKAASRWSRARFSTSSRVRRLVSLKAQRGRSYDLVDFWGGVTICSSSAMKLGTMRHIGQSGSSRHPAKQSGRHGGTFLRGRAGRGLAPVHPCFSTGRGIASPRGGRWRLDSSPNGPHRTNLPSVQYLSPAPGQLHDAWGRLITGGSPGGAPGESRPSGLRRIV